MTIKTTLGAIAALAGVAAPAAAQSAYPQNYGQPSYGYQQPGYGYQQPGYGYQQGYAQNPISQMIDSLLGNRYQANDRQAVSQCASVALSQAQAQYRGGYGYGQQAYGQPNYGQQRYQQNMRITSITNVERRSGGLRVSGLIDSGRHAYGYGQQAYGQGYNQAYANRTGDLSFRCDVDYRGAVRNVRVRQYDGYRRY